MPNPRIQGSGNTALAFDARGTPPVQTLAELGIKWNPLAVPGSHTFFGKGSGHTVSYGDALTARLPFALRRLGFDEPATSFELLRPVGIEGPVGALYDMAMERAYAAIRRHGVDPQRTHETELTLVNPKGTELVVAALVEFKSVTGMSRLSSFVLVSVDGSRVEVLAAS